MVQYICSARGYGIVMREGISGGDSCSKHKAGVGKVDNPDPEGVTFCLGNVTAA